MLCSSTAKTSSFVDRKPNSIGLDRTDLTPSLVDATDDHYAMVIRDDTCSRLATDIWGVASWTITQIETLERWPPEYETTPPSHETPDENARHDALNGCTLTSC